MIDVICIRCGYPQAAHTLGGRCADGGMATGFMLQDLHALDEVPPALRALERARLAQERHDLRNDVQLRLGADDG